MSTNASGTKESIDALDDRDIRALTRHVSVLSAFGDAEPSEYVVVGESGTERHVDVLAGTCDCPDHEHRGVRCYHLRAADFASGRRPIPAWVDRGSINNSLGAHIEDAPVFASEADAEAADVTEATEQVMTDGGTVVSDDEPLGESEESGRPDDCSCIAEMDPDDLGCWPCYRDGFETRNPDAEALLENEAEQVVDEMVAEVTE